jgi:WD40 repeat protein
VQQLDVPGYSYSILDKIVGYSDAIFNVGDIAFSPDSNLLAAVARKNICLWSVKDGKFLRKFEGINDYRGVAFSPDGSLLAGSAPANKEIRVWSVKDSSLVHNLRGSAQKVVFSPDNNILVTADFDSVMFWSVKEGDLIYKLDCRAKSLAFSPDGSWIAIAGDRLRIWAIDY